MYEAEEINVAIKRTRSMNVWSWVDECRELGRLMYRPRKMHVESLEIK